MKKKAIAENIAEKTHCSLKRAIEDIPFLQQIFLNNKTEADNLINYYDFDKEEAAWLVK